MRKQGHISDLDSLFAEGVLKRLHSYLPEDYHIFYVLSSGGTSNIDIIFYMEEVINVKGTKPESKYKFKENKLEDISLGKIIGFIATIEYIDKKIKKKNLIDNLEKSASSPDVKDNIELAEYDLGDSLLCMEIISFKSYSNLKGIGSLLLVLFIEFSYTLSKIYNDTIITILESSNFSQDNFHPFIKDFGPYPLETLTTKKGKYNLIQFLLKKKNGFREAIEKHQQIKLEDFILPISKILLDDNTGNIREPNNIYMKYGFEYREEFDPAMIGDISRIHDNALRIFIDRYSNGSFLASNSKKKKESDIT